MWPPPPPPRAQQCMGPADTAHGPTTDPKTILWDQLEISPTTCLAWCGGQHYQPHGPGLIQAPLVAAYVSQKRDRCMQALPF